MRIDNHMHTPLCGHAYGQPNDYVAMAAARDFDLITFTCHVPMPQERFGGRGIRMHRDELGEYRMLIAEAAEKGKQMGVKVLCGIEAEIFPDEDVMKWQDELLAEQAFDFVLGSLHSALPSYRERLEQAGAVTDDQKIDRYFGDLIDGLHSGRYNSLSHPDVIRLYGVIDRFDPLPHEKVIRELLKDAATMDQCLEVNTSGLIKGDYKVHPEPQILDWAAEYAVRFTIGSDSHQALTIGQKFDEVLPMLYSKGIDKLHYFKAGQRMEVPNWIKE